MFLLDADVTRTNNFTLEQIRHTAHLELAIILTYEHDPQTRSAEAT